VRRHVPIPGKVFALECAHHRRNLPLNPLSRNCRDWLYAFALLGMLLRASMPLWAMPQLAAGGFMLFCTSQGMQWQLGDQSDSASATHQLPCAQCGAHLASVQSFPFLPPAPAVSQPQRPYVSGPLQRHPPFLVAPPGRAPPTFS